MKIRFGQIELARGLALRESPTRLALSTVREAQVARAVRAAAAEVFDRGNARTVVAFTVARRHETIERAQYFVAAHPPALAAETGGLTFISEDGAHQAEMYLPDAILRSVRCEPAGLVTNTEYEFLGSTLTSRPSASA